MKNVKRIAALLLALVMVFALCACSDSGSGKDKDKDDKVCLLYTSPSPRDS